MRGKDKINAQVNVLLLGVVTIKLDARAYAEFMTLED